MFLQKFLNSDNLRILNALNPWCTNGLECNYKKIVKELKFKNEVFNEESFVAFKTIHFENWQCFFAKEENKESYKNLFNNQLVSNDLCFTSKDCCLNCLSKPPNSPRKNRVKIGLKIFSHFDENYRFIKSGEILITKNIGDGLIYFIGEQIDCTENKYFLGKTSEETFISDNFTFIIVSRFNKGDICSNFSNIFCYKSNNILINKETGWLRKKFNFEINQNARYQNFFGKYKIPVVINRFGNECFMINFVSPDTFICLIKNELNKLQKVVFNKKGVYLHQNFETYTMKRIDHFYLCLKEDYESKIYKAFFLHLKSKCRIKSIILKIQNKNHKVYLIYLINSLLHTDKKSLLVFDQDKFYQISSKEDINFFNLKENTFDVMKPVSMNNLNFLKSIQIY